MKNKFKTKIFYFIKFATTILFLSSFHKAEIYTKMDKKDYFVKFPKFSNPLIIFKADIQYNLKAQILDFFFNAR